MTRRLRWDYRNDIRAEEKSPVTFKGFLAEVEEDHAHVAPVVLVHDPS